MITKIDTYKIKHKSNIQTLVCDCDNFIEANKNNFSNKF
jgi:hypothetical protein